MRKTWPIHSQFLGLIPYSKALNLQERLREELISGELCAHQLLGLEHPSVITLGKRADIAREIFNASGTETVRIERGGLATLHNPGQLVIYPIFHLQKLGIGVRRWVEILLETTAETLQNLGVPASSQFNPAGVYTALGKIAFVGVQIRRGVSTHGLSINIKNDLKEFGKIRSCGLSEAHLDSLAHHQIKIGTEDFFERWSVVFFENIRKVKAPLHAGLISESDGIGPAGGGFTGSNH